jgi:hypothetical protein
MGRVFRQRGVRTVETDISGCEACKRGLAIWVAGWQFVARPEKVPA